MNLYLTADSIGTPTGGGSVTYHESAALRELGPCEVWGREQLQQGCAPWQGLTNEEPWVWDEIALGKAFTQLKTVPRLAHIYAGTFTRTVAQALKQNGCKVVYTAAAHDVAASRRAHEELGLPFDYSHLNDPTLWARYVKGYLDADVLVCPSQHSVDVMRGFGARQRIEVIPHGVDLPKCVQCDGLGGAVSTLSGSSSLPVVICNACKSTGNAPAAPLPPRFTVGYLGAYGPDKNVVSLLRAWAKLNYQDAVLVLGGRDSNSQWVHALLQHTGARNVCLAGWLDNVSDFYDGISLYVQPSVTEGFGCEVLEAMAHGRPVLCSRGAGAADLVPEGWRFAPGNVDELAGKINDVKVRGDVTGLGCPRWRDIAEGYTWPKIRTRYQALWRSLL